MSFSGVVPLTYTQYSIQNEPEDNNYILIEGDKEINPDPNFKVLPPIQPLGNLFTNMNINYKSQESIEVFNTSTDVISTTTFNPENKHKQQVVFETDKKNNYVVMLDENKHKEIIVEKKENMDYETIKFTKDKSTYSNSLSGTFYIASITVVGLFIVYRMIQKSR
jgi:hypothetical protein